MSFSWENLIYLYSYTLQDILETHPRNKTRLNVNRPPEEEGSAFESDIILTKQQAEEIAADVLHQGKRKRRQAVISSTQLWPKGIIVYKYDDQFRKLIQIEKSNGLSTIKLNPRLTQYW